MKHIGWHIEIDEEPVRFANEMKIRFSDTDQSSGKRKARTYAVRHYPEECAEGRVKIKEGIHPRAMAFYRGAERGALKC